MTNAHKAPDWTGDITINYTGQKNLVIRCPDCNTEHGHRVAPGTTLGPNSSKFAACPTCNSWKDHYPIREAERGEYDSQFSCDACDTMYSNTMDADMCCNDDSPQDARSEFATNA